MDDKLDLTALLCGETDRVDFEIEFQIDPSDAPYGVVFPDPVRAKGTVSNLRGGFGIGISHYECEKCHNLDAGFMREIYEDLDEKIYYRSVIGLYQGIRGFAKE